MKRIEDIGKSVVGYFTDKYKKEIHTEIEKKVLNINISEIEKILENENAIEVFDGIVISYYYHFKETEYDPLSQILGFRDEKKRPWLRLRVMIDNKSNKNMHFIETKNTIKKGNYEEEGVITSNTYIKFIKNILKDNKVDYNKEIKNRRIYLLPDDKTYIKGLEFNIDTINHPVIIPTFLEIEAESDELLYLGIEKSKIDKNEFQEISCRKLIKDAEEGIIYKRT